MLKELKYSKIKNHSPPGRGCRGDPTDLAEEEEKTMELGGLDIELPAMEVGVIGLEMCAQVREARASNRGRSNAGLGWCVLLVRGEKGFGVERILGC